MCLTMYKSVSCHLLNHMHDVRSISTSLERSLSNTLDLTLDEVKYTEGSSILCHPVEQVFGKV